MLSPQRRNFFRSAIAASIALHVFWILLFKKEASKAFADAITIHQGVGPLSGLFLYATLAGILAFLFLHLWQPKDLGRLLPFATWLLILSTVAFLILVYPPVFHSILT